MPVGDTCRETRSKMPPAACYRGRRRWIPKASNTARTGQDSSDGTGTDVAASETVLRQPCDHYSRLNDSRRRWSSCQCREVRWYYRVRVDHRKPVSMKVRCSTSQMGADVHVRWQWSARAGLITICPTAPAGPRDDFTAVRRPRVATLTARDDFAVPPEHDRQ